MIDDRLDGRHVIVSGGAQGIGRGIASRAARAGADITIFDTQPVTDPETITTDTRVNALNVDVSDPGDVRAGVEASIEELGPIHGLVNNAGIQTQSPALSTSEADWDRHFEVNAKESFLCSREVAKHMVDRGIEGSIVNVASVAAGERPNHGQGAYGASKAAVVTLTTVLAKELGEHGITCNAINPGAVDTPMYRRLLSKTHAEEDLSGEEMIEQAGDRHLVGRVGEPEDVGHVATLLLSEESEWITGQAFVVDGGVVHR